MIEIKTYGEFDNYIKAFSKKKINLMVIVSRGGLGKSFATEQALLKEAPLTFSGHATPLSIYKELYRATKEEKNKDPFVVFDDVDTLICNKTNVALLKQICDTKETKQVRYGSTTKLLEEVPYEYETKCNVILLTNLLTPRNANVKALLTRGHHIHFNPSNVEVVNHLRGFAKNKPIVKLMSELAPFSTRLNLRSYVLAKELDDSNLDWRTFVQESLEVDPKIRLISNLMVQYEDDISRLKHYPHSRMDYYRYKKKYLNNKGVIK